MIWLIPGFFAAFGVLFALFARPFAEFYRGMQRPGAAQKETGTGDRGVAQVRGLGAALLVTAAVFAVLILAGVLP